MFKLQLWYLKTPAKPGIVNDIVGSLFGSPEVFQTFLDPYLGITSQNISFRNHREIFRHTLILYVIKLITFHFL